MGTNNAAGGTYFRINGPKQAKIVEIKPVKKLTANAALYAIWNASAVDTPFDVWIKYTGSVVSLIHYC